MTTFPRAAPTTVVPPLHAFFAGPSFPPERKQLSRPQHTKHPKAGMILSPPETQTRPDQHDDKTRQAKEEEEKNTQQKLLIIPPRQHGNHPNGGAPPHPTPRARGIPTSHTRGGVRTYVRVRLFSTDGSSGLVIPVRAPAGCVCQGLPKLYQGLPKIYQGLSNIYQGLPNMYQDLSRSTKICQDLPRSTTSTKIYQDLPRSVRRDEKATSLRR